jgi:hypothetical protein
MIQTSNGEKEKEKDDQNKQRRRLKRENVPKCPMKKMKKRICIKIIDEEDLKRKMSK